MNKFTLAVVLAAIFAAPSVAAHHDRLSVDDAKKMVAAATQEAKKRGVGGSIAVVDHTGYLIYLERIDGSFPASAPVAARKAHTAAIFGMPTQNFEKAIRSGRVSITAVPEIQPLEGGIPILSDGRILGALGVSGASSSTEDVELAEIAIAALGLD